MNYRRSILLGAVLGVAVVTGLAAFTDPNIFTTPFTRNLLRANSQDAAKAVLGLSSGVINSTVTNSLIAVDETKTNVIPATSAMVTNALGYAPQQASSNLTTLATLNGNALTNIAASNIVSGGQLPMGALTSDSVTTGGVYYAKSGSARGLASGVTITGGTSLTVSGDATAANFLATTGLYFPAGNYNGIYSTGGDVLYIGKPTSRIVTSTGSSQRMTLPSTGTLEFSSAAGNATTATILSGADTIIARDAANTVALRNGTSGNALNVYNTFTDTSNFERGSVAWKTNAMVIGSEKAGSGSSRSVQFQEGGTNIFYLDGNSGGLKWNTDATHDIGASAANRPKNVYVGGNLNVDSLTASRAVVSGADKSLASSATTSTELGYVSGVTSAIQTQLDGKQPASANLTNWSAIAATSAGIQSTLGQVYQATNSNLTTLATLNGASLTNIAASNIVSGGQLPMGTLSADSVTTGGIYYAKDANSRGIASGVTIGAATNLTASTLYASQSFRQYEGAALTHAGTVTLDFNAANPKTSITLTGDVTFAFSNVDTNKTYILRVYNNQSTNCAITFPTGSSTNFLGGAPTYVTTKKYARWIMSCVGTGDTNVLSAWAEN